MGTTDIGCVAKGDQHISGLGELVGASYGGSEQGFGNISSVFPNLSYLHRLLVDFILDGAAVVSRVGHARVKRAGAEIAVIIDQERPLRSEHGGVLGVVPLVGRADRSQQVGPKSRVPVLWGTQNPFERA